jgi:DNA polymerase III delta prime subunit
MNSLEKLFPQNLYHSYIIEGDPNSLSLEILNFLENRGEIIKQSPDVICQTYESFTIEDNKQIKEWHSRLGISKAKKVCILATKFINREAEQALLKMIEEPALNSHFFIIVPDSSLLLDTIISRTHLIKIDKKDDLELRKFVNIFIKLSPKDRIDKIAEIIKENKDEENSGKLRSYATYFINELEVIFYQNFKKNINDKNNKFILEELQKARGYLSTPGASVKMILEHIALVL